MLSIPSRDFAFIFILIIIFVVVCSFALGFGYVCVSFIFAMCRFYAKIIAECTVGKWDDAQVVSTMVSFVHFSQNEYRNGEMKEKRNETY